MKKSYKLQASLDMLIAYAFLFGVLVFILYFIYIDQTSLTYLSPQECLSQQPFICYKAFIQSNGTLIIQISQASNYIIRIDGIACSTLINQSNGLPAYGNRFVTSAASFYPKQQLPAYLYPSQKEVYYIYCYYAGDAIARANPGSIFNAYIWINYTIVGLNKSFVAKDIYFYSRYV
ncbi:MAG: hypothetical protein ARM1_0177 [Candidatus Micrarchaeota archaeon]|nr:MAG: hypothetical protein ARM1_0177 [Candidatus Micrarchaeota archaeon]